jgi:hypothetical protein
MNRLRGSIEGKAIVRQWDEHLDEFQTSFKNKLFVYEIPMFYQTPMDMKIMKKQI